MNEVETAFAGMVAESLGYDSSRVEVSIEESPDNDGVHGWTHLRVSIDGSHMITQHEQETILAVLKAMGVDGATPVEGSA